MGKTNYAENKVLDWCVGRTVSAITAYVALFTSAPGETGGGTEVTGGSYARKATTSSDWGTAASGSISNAVNLDFPLATAAWGTVTHFGILDAASGGNLIRYAALTTPLVVAVNDTPRFVVGGLTLTED